MKKAFKLFCIVGIISLIFFSCKKESTDNDSTGTGEVEFSLNLDVLKSSSSIDFSAISKVVLKLESTSDEDDTISDGYINLELYKMNDSYFTEDLELVVGEYNLAQFFIEDTTDNVVYATPLLGANQAANVDNPLPISFSISTDEVTSVDVEVLPTEGLDASDFGLSVFNIDFASTLSFIMGTIDSLSYVPISSEVTIVSGSEYSYTQELDSTLTNVLQIKDGFDSYEFSFTKDGYQTRTVTFTNQELQSYTSNVLTVKLLSNSTLSDYVMLQYNLDGDLNDYSGNNYNLDLTGTSVEYSADRNDNESSACYFNGSEGSALYDQDLTDQSSAQSVSVWFKTTDTNSTPDYGGFFFVLNSSSNSRFSVFMQDGYVKGHYGNETSSEVYLDEISSEDTYNDGTWHHVVFVSTGDEGTLYLYVDGELVSSKEVTISNHSTTSGIDIKIGGDSSKNYFTGTIDNVVLYSKALSASEVQEIYAE